VTEKRFTHRTLKANPTPEERTLADAIIGILSKSVHDLPGIVAGLNSAKIPAPGGGTWQEQTFKTEIEKLGFYPNSIGGPLGSHPVGVVPAGNSSTARPTSRMGDLANGR
jgi:hypothetical protein